jgi:predicted histone-like DNA-binding protein
MSIKFNVVQRANPQKRDEPAKYYANIIGDGKTTLEDLAKYAAEMSTVSKADIVAVMESIFGKIASDIADGKIVYVGGYFTLQAGGSSIGEEKEADVNSASIKSIRAVFRPGKMIKDTLKLATFQKKK